MKASELRIGNYINYRIEDKLDERKEWLELSQIDAIDLKCIDDDYSPIPITEQWLLEHNFEEYYRDENKLIFQHKEHFYIEIHLLPEINFFYRSEPIPNKKYIHQIQNIFFGITGEEL